MRYLFSILCLCLSVSLFAFGQFAAGAADLQPGCYHVERLKQSFKDVLRDGSVVGLSNSDALAYARTFFKISAQPKKRPSEAFVFVLGSGAIILVINLKDGGCERVGLPGSAHLKIMKAIKGREV